MAVLTKKAEEWILRNVFMAYHEIRSVIDLDDLRASNEVVLISKEEYDELVSDRELLNSISF